MDKFVRGKVLGKGSFGCAILVTNKLDGKNYVIKEIDISRMPKAEREASEQEAKVRAGQGGMADGLGVRLSRYCIVLPPGVQAQL